MSGGTIAVTTPHVATHPRSNGTGDVAHDLAGPKSTLVSKWMATRLNYVCDHHPVLKPQHRTVSKPVEMAPGVMTTFVVGRFLNDVSTHFIAENHQVLGEAGKRLLLEVAWFRPWLHRLCWMRGVPVPNDGAYSAGVNAPMIDEEVDMLVAAFPNERPHQADMVTVMRRNGMTHKLVVRSVCAKLAKAITKRGMGGITEERIREFRKLPWAHRWISKCRQKEQKRNVHQVVGKELKVSLLLINCGRACPSKDMAVPVCGPGIKGVYEWFPSAWLDEIADNWVWGDSARPSANHLLSVAQTRALETLPWLCGWLRDVREEREERARVKARQIASQSAM